MRQNVGMSKSDKEKAVDIILDRLRKRLMNASEFTVETDYGTDTHGSMGRHVPVYNGRDTITIKIDGGAGK